MRALGSEVTLIHRREHLLRGFDDDVRNTVEAAYHRRGIVLKMGHTIKRIVTSSAGRIVIFAHDTIAAIALVMVATARKADIDWLGLKAAGVETRDVAIPVHHYSPTSTPPILAAGPRHP